MVDALRVSAVNLKIGRVKRGRCSLCAVKIAHLSRSQPPLDNASQLGLFCKALTALFRRAIRQQAQPPEELTVALHAQDVRALKFDVVWGTSPVALA